MAILKRELLYSVKGGHVKFLDWAITATTLGACAEPYHIGFHAPGEGFVDLDPSDEMVKVDSLYQVEDEDGAIRALSSGGPAIHGGALLPRVFIFTGDN